MPIRETSTPTPIEAIFLDLDSTIVDERYIEIASVAACVEIAAAHPQFDPGLLARSNLETWLSYWPEIEDPWTLGELDTADLRFEVWRRTFAPFGGADDATITDAVEIHHSYERREYRAFDDVAPLLAAARRAGIKLGVITNGASETQREKLADLGLSNAFDAIIVSAEVGAAKPDPTIFEHATKALGVSPAASIHVGDSVFADIGGAVAAGVHAVWLNRDGSVPKPGLATPDRVIASLAELLPLG